MEIVKNAPMHLYLNNDSDLFGMYIGDKFLDTMGNVFNVALSPNDEIIIDGVGMVRNQMPSTLRMGDIYSVAMCGHMKFASYVLRIMTHARCDKMHMGVAYDIYFQLLKLAINKAMHKHFPRSRVRWLCSDEDMGTVSSKPLFGVSDKYKKAYGTVKTMYFKVIFDGDKSKEGSKSKHEPRDKMDFVMNKFSELSVSRTATNMVGYKMFFEHLDGDRYAIHVKIYLRESLFENDTDMICMVGAWLYYADCGNGDLEKLKTSIYKNASGHYRYYCTQPDDGVCYCIHNKIREINRKG